MLEQYAMNVANKCTVALLRHVTACLLMMKPRRPLGGILLRITDTRSHGETSSWQPVQEPSSRALSYQNVKKTRVFQGS